MSEPARFSRCALNPMVAILLSLGAGACAKPVQQEPLPSGGEGAPKQAGKIAASSAAFGFTPFPYDFTIEALDRTHQIVAEHGTLYGIHLDDGIPWGEALRNEPLPAKERGKWDDLARRRPSGHKVYLGLAPLAKDRKSLAPATEGSMATGKLQLDGFDAPAVKTAYLNYARRAVEKFAPDYLNLGIEAGELAARDRARWPAFAELYEHVRSNLKREYPRLQIGISFGLQSLMEEDVADRVRGVVKASDYVGLSFYPYMSAFHEKFGAAPLPGPPGQWREPLEWVRAFTNKPIALCETGYSSRSIDLPNWGLHMHGDPVLQEQYVVDLGQIARRDGYLFVVWFMPVDYDRMFAGLKTGDNTYLLWQNVGLFDSQLAPKPAWARWCGIIEGGLKDTVAVDAASKKRPGIGDNQTAGSAAAGGPAVLAFDFSDERNLFSGSADDDLAVSDVGPRSGTRSMQWSFTYEKDRWQWCVLTLRPGALKGSQGLRFSVRSDRKGPIIVQLEEQSGEAFFTTVEVTRDWREVVLDVDRFAVDPQKQRDGQLDVAEVTSILLADAAATEGATGRRKILVADWSFPRELVTTLTDD